MAVIFNRRVLLTGGLVKWLVILLVLCYVKVQAESLRTKQFKRTVTTARCTANCYTLYGDRNNASDNICQTTACKECLLPCGETFGNETLCLNSCNNSVSCGASCRFLTHLKKFSSILAGDGSKSPTPGIPTEKNTTFDSITLEWDPVRLNTSGTPMYIIGMSHKGDWDINLFYFKHVFTVPRGTLTTDELCSFVPKGGRLFSRAFFKGIYYKFNIAVVTDNSSVSYGAETIRNITLPMPKPVSNITVTSIVYKSNQPRTRKLQLTATWSPPVGDSDVVSNYAMVWTAASECKEFVLPLRVNIMSGPATSGSISFDEDIKKCNPMLTVYALNNCIPSNGTTLTFEYPGCLNTTNYPKEECYRFDPPYAPAEDRKVRDISYRLASINQDYTFYMNVSWRPPPYPYKGISEYIVFWERLYSSSELYEFPSFGYAKGPSIAVGPLRPKEVYAVKIIPDFVDFTPEGLSKNITIPMPGVDPAQVTVRNLKLESFTFSPQIGAFELNITWQKPAFNYSSITAYKIAYQVNEGNVISTNTDKTYFPIFGILHGQPISVNVTPEYAHDWITGTKHPGRGNAPALRPGQLTVRNFLLRNFIISPQTGKYDLNVTWDKPFFNYSEILTYSLKFRVDRGNEVAAQTNKTYFVIHGISHGESVIFKVKPYYRNRWIIGKENQRMTKAPVPADEKVKVTNLQATKFVEDKDSNTFAVNFTWDPPLFQYRIVRYYNLSYVFSGYQRDQFPCPGALVKEHGCKITGIKDTSYQISGILPREHISIAVAPVYNDEYIKGKKTEADDNAPAPRGELLRVVGIRHDEILPSSNNSFRTIVRWQKPLFTHSAVSYYRYKVTKKNEGRAQRKAIDFLTTRNTNVTIDGILVNEEIVFQVTPEFDVDIVMGIEAKLSILKTSKHKALGSFTPGEISALVVGLLLLIVIVVCLMIWHRRRKPNWPEVLIDHWEVDGNLVSLEEEIGEGAFGKVYKGTLKELTTNAQKPFLKSAMKTTRSINGSEMFTVAVKMLHNISDSEQRREFLEEIQLMKAVGSHKNIVNMIGCCTIEEPMFLLTEYIPYGDLLRYLRKRRGKVKENLGDDSRGPFRSTYCETYFTNDNSTGISVKATKSDRIYVNAPEMPREENKDIQIISFSTSRSEDQVQTGEVNESLEMEEEESEDNEEVLTPGDLMAFAWQITQAMEYLAKKGFVHRDLAARNVLVGENKIAKVGDFGLTRHVYEGNVYYAKRNRKLPLKWMSIEAIFDQTFTSQSDVWAFGVVLWELVTLGGTPYPTIDNKELLRLLKNGYRMEKPDTCNEEIYKMMTDCWKATPESRPTFTQLRESLEIIMQKDNPYLDLSAVDETCAYYNVPSFNSITEESSGDSFESERDDTQKDESTKYVKFDVEGTVTEPNGNVTLKEPQIVDQSTEINNKIKNELNEKNKLSGINVPQDPKDVRINFNDLEKMIYRPARRGVAF